MFHPTAEVRSRRPVKLAAALGLIPAAAITAASAGSIGLVLAGSYGIAVGLVVSAVCLWIAPWVRQGYADADQLIRLVSDYGRLQDRLGKLLLYAEPPAFAVERTDPHSGELLAWPITPDVHAEVETAGSITVTRGRNLAAKAVGGALVPGGVFLFGNARDRVHDHRELYLIVEGPDWAHTIPLDPALGAEARRFAQSINLVARQQPGLSAAPAS